MMSSLRWVQDMMTSDDKVGGWVKKGQNHDDVILECPPMGMCFALPSFLIFKQCELLAAAERPLQKRSDKLPIFTGFTAS